jgi:type IV pilus assembly protein PilY1
VDRTLPSMTQPIAARVAAMDLDGDEYADRLYAADVGGRVWRFDIWNGRPREELITGGVFASLGSVPPLRAPVAAADARRFFNAPDVALMLPRGQAPWISLSLGSGDASDPGATGVSERFYSLRDGQAFARLSQAAYEDMEPIFDDDLIDIAANPAGTALPEGSPGWKLPLEGKVVAGSVTANGVVLFTTYTPAATGAERCEDGIGVVYALTIEGGQAALDLDNDGELTVDDRSAVLEEPGIPPGPRIEITPPSEGEAPDEPDAPPSPGDAPTSRTRCYVGDERLTACIALGTLKRTFWKRTLVN